MSQVVIHTCIATRANGTPWLHACYLGPGDACPKCGSKLAESDVRAADGDNAEPAVV